MNLIIDRLLIATHNPAKAARYREIFAPYAGEVLTLNDLAITGKPVENGETAEANAEIKARAYARQAHMLAFAEDEALYVNFLPSNQQPGVHVRRINGYEEASDEQLLAHWERIVAGVAPEERSGRWHVAYCLARPDGPVKTIALDLPILFFYPSSAIKIPGWPMSSLEGPLEFNKPHSELSDQERQLANQRIDQALARAIQEIL